MRRVLLLAAAYNLLWGAWVVLWPQQLFQWLSMEPPLYPGIWQCVGMIVGVYGIGYGIAARDPFRHWPIVLVGFLGKIFGPIGFLAAALEGELPWAFGLTLPTNDLVWWAPFAIILWSAFRHGQRRTGATLDLDELLAVSRTSHGPTTAELSHQRPVLMVLLRHFGCTFCRQTLADLAERRAALDGGGVTIVLVHQSTDNRAAEHFARYQLDDLPRISDPDCSFYRAARLPRGTFGQLFGRRVWWQGFRAAIFGGHGIGRLEGDGFQMPGAFLVHRGQVTAMQRYHSAADRPDLLTFTEKHRPAK